MPTPEQEALREKVARAYSPADGEERMIGP